MKENSLQRGISGAVLLFSIGAMTAVAQSNLTIYQDSLGTGWADWSWGGTVSRTNTSPVHSGTYSMSATLDPYGAVSLCHDSMTWTQYHAIEFYVRGGTNTNLNIIVCAQTEGKEFTYLPVTNYVEGKSVGTGVWKKAWVPIADFGITSSGVTRINWKNESTSYLSPFFLDDIRLVNTNTPAGDTNMVNDFSITSRWSETDGGLAIEFSGQTCAYYQVWMATSLLDGVWSEVDMALGAAALQVWTNTLTADTTFVKFSGLLQKNSWDADGDSLLDVYELTHLPLDPLSPFSDADGLPDGWEFQFGLSPTNSMGNDGDSGDPDADGRSNLMEYDGGMNPQYIERSEMPLYLDYNTGPWDLSAANAWQETMNATYAYANQYSLRMGLTGQNGHVIFELRTGSVSLVGFTNLEFWVNGGSNSGHVFEVGVKIGTGVWNTVSANSYVTVRKTNWSFACIPLTHLGADGATNLTQIFFKNTNTTPVSQLWVDNLKLVKWWPANPPTISVTATSAVSRTITRRMLGMNTATWDGLLTNTTSRDRLLESGITMLRFPGGSAGDTYDWQKNTNKTTSSWYEVNTSNFLVLADSLGAEKNITVNYGSGSATEASNWVKHVFGTLNRTVDWWCVGNESYASWEYDTNNPARDAVKYASRWREYRTGMTNARPGIKVGIVLTFSQDDFTNAHGAVTNPADATTHRGWSAVLLHELSNSPPDFVEVHYYGYANNTVPEITPERANDYHLLQSVRRERDAIRETRKMLCDYLGNVNGSNVAIHITESNYTGYNIGKQMLSLVNAFYAIDMFGQACLGDADAFVWWDVHNGIDTNYNTSSTLYGWRNYGDYGILASSTNFGDAINERYPVFYAFKLLTNFARPGDHLVEVTNSYPDVLHAYACIPPDTGSVRLLVINTAPDSDLRPTISLDGFNAGSSAMAFSYGMSNDLNREDITVTSVAVNPTNIQYTFPKYSMTVIRFQ